MDDLGTSGHWDESSGRVIAEGWAASMTERERREARGAMEKRKVRVDAVLVLMAWALLVGMSVGIWICEGGH